MSFVKRLGTVHLYWLGLVSLVLLFLAEQYVASLGLWFFVVLSLSLGMGHGALDAILLIAQYTSYSKAFLYALGYLLLVLVTAWLLSMSIAWAIGILLVMSVWHFGEMYGQHIALRLVVGGASVMAPVLFHADVMAHIVSSIAGSQASEIYKLWLIAAWIWVLSAAMTVCWLSLARTIIDIKMMRQTWLELSCVLLIFAVLSPLLAFAIYFGLYHCTQHIARIYRAYRRHSTTTNTFMFWACAMSGLITALLLWLLWSYLPHAAAATDMSGQVLQWLVIALAAVTLPHMLLVSASQHWLKN
jgi:beta-carotene 15,15'-dioxygenase